MVHAASAAEADLSVGVDDVVAQPVVQGVAVAGSGGFGQGCVGGGRGAPVEFAVRSTSVVELAEPVELGLQFGDGRCRRLLGEPAFECLMPALDLALGLRMAGVTVLLRDTQGREQVLEAVLPADEAGGVDAAVVGQCGRREPVFVDVVAEAGQDVIAGDAAVGGAGQQQSGVVIEPVQDLDVAAVGQGPVREV
jgi:hypothetical protein